MGIYSFHDHLLLLHYCIRFLYHRLTAHFLLFLLSQSKRIPFIEPLIDPLLPIRGRVSHKFFSRWGSHIRPCLCWLASLRPLHATEGIPWPWDAPLQLLIDQRVLHLHHLLGHSVHLFPGVLNLRNALGHFFLSRMMSHY